MYIFLKNRKGISRPVMIISSLINIVAQDTELRRS